MTFLQEPGYGGSNDVERPEVPLLPVEGSQSPVYIAHGEEAVTLHPALLRAMAGSLMKEMTQPPNLFYHASKQVADYSFKEEIQSIIYVDTSARPARAGIEEYWRHSYPDTPRPSAFFLNPDTFGMPLQEGLIPISGAEATSYANKIETQLRDSKNALLGKRNENILLFDLCTHTGAALLKMKAMLDELAFTSVRIGVLTDESFGKAPVELDFSSTDDFTQLSCRPFGRDRNLHKNPDTPHVQRGEVDMKAMMHRRLLIQRRVREGIAAEQYRNELAPYLSDLQRVVDITDRQ